MVSLKTGVILKLIKWWKDLSKIWFYEIQRNCWCICPILPVCSKMPEVCWILLAFVFSGCDFK